MAKSGRPKSSATIEKERVTELLNNIPTHVSRLTDENLAQLKFLFDKSDREFQELINDYSKRYGKAFSRKLILQLASIGDESLIGHETEILKFFEKKSAHLKISQKKGGQVNSEKAFNRGKKLWANNSDLTNRISKNLTIHGASIKILEDWDSRGDSQKKPSLNTLRNWYNKIK